MDDGDEPPRPERRRPGREDGPAARPAGDAETGAEADTEAGEEADFRALAEDWIAIWQSEITAYLTDPETQQAWGSMMAIWAGAAQAMVRAMPPLHGFGPPYPAAGPRPARRRKSDRTAAHERHPAPAAAESTRPDAPPGAAAASAAPVARDDEIRRLEQRLAELERHIAERDRAEQDRRRGAAGENRRTRRTSRPRG